MDAWHSGFSFLVITMLVLAGLALLATYLPQVLALAVLLAVVYCILRGRCP